MQNWALGSAGTLTLLREEIYLKRNAGTRHATAKCRSAGTRHAKDLQELAPSSARLWDAAGTRGYIQRTG